MMMSKLSTRFMTLPKNGWPGQKEKRARRRLCERRSDAIPYELKVEEVEKGAGVFGGYLSIIKCNLMILFII